VISYVRDCSKNHGTCVDSGNSDSDWCDGAGVSRPERMTNFRFAAGQKREEDVN
jgi:hypothetical protein